MHNPATGEPPAEAPAADDAAVDRAVNGAARAFAAGTWAGLQPADQESVLRRLTALIDEHAEELAWLEVLDNGKTLAEARGDVGGGRSSRTTPGGPRSSVATSTARPALPRILGG